MSKILSIIFQKIIEVYLLKKILSSVVKRVNILISTRITFLFLSMEIQKFMGYSMVMV